MDDDGRPGVLSESMDKEGHYRKITQRVIHGLSLEDDAPPTSHEDHVAATASSASAATVAVPEDGTDNDEETVTPPRSKCPDSRSTCASESHGSFACSQQHENACSNNVYGISSGVYSMDSHPNFQMTQTNFSACDPDFCVSVAEQQQQ